MITKSQRRISARTNANSVPTTDITNSEGKSITAQDYKKMLQKRLYKLESESMPAT